MRPARRLLLIFAIAILAPALVLGGLGIRALVQERRLAEQQAVERISSAAESVGRRLESELTQWQQAIQEIAKSDLTDPAQWPERVRHVIAEPGGGVVLLGSRGRVHATPAQQLLYGIASHPDDPRIETLPPLLAQAESLELRARRYDAAISIYRDVLSGAKPGERAGVLHRLARTLTKAGRSEEATRVYEQLAQEPSVLVGSLPSDLLAMYEIARGAAGANRADRASALYQGLVEGRWRLSKASYAYYSEYAGEGGARRKAERECGSPQARHGSSALHRNDAWGFLLLRADGVETHGALGHLRSHTGPRDGQATIARKIPVRAFGRVQRRARLVSRRRIDRIQAPPARERANS